MRHLITAIIATMGLSACVVDEYDYENDDRFPLERHELLPPLDVEGMQIAAGAVTGEGAALEQPIPFSHNVHADTLGINCQFCHSEARKSKHSGVPPVQTCMNCHAYVKTDNADVQKIHQAYCGKDKCLPGVDMREDKFGQPIAPENGNTIRWNKVHDLPDYVHFSHKRHIRGGLNCTECHGQVQLQGQKVPTVDEHGETVMAVENVMIRETTLQMGWCLGCHENHPSIAENYGEGQEHIRRAELKDCWTCHK